MRAFLAKGGIYTWINSRENTFLNEKFSQEEMLNKSDLTEREDFIAKNLVTRGVLDKVVDRNGTYYKLSMNNLNR